MISLVELSCILMQVGGSFFGCFLYFFFFIFWCLFCFFFLFRAICIFFALMTPMVENVCCCFLFSFNLISFSFFLFLPFCFVFLGVLVNVCCFLFCCVYLLVFSADFVFCSLLYLRLLGFLFLLYVFMFAFLIFCLSCHFFALDFF